MANDKGQQFRRQLDRVAANTDEAGRVRAAPAKSAAGEAKRKAQDQQGDKPLRPLDKQPYKRAKGDNLVVATAPQPAHGKAKDDSAAERNQQAAQSVGPFVPVPIERSNSTMLGGAKARDQADNTTLLALGGTALACWMFVQMRYGR